MVSKDEIKGYLFSRMELHRKVPFVV